MGWRACNPEVQGTVTIRETGLGQLPPPRHCTDSRVKHTPSLPVKEASLHGTCLGIYRSALGERRLGDAASEPSPTLLHLASISQKGVYTLVRLLHVCSCCQGTAPYCLALVASGLCTHGSHRTATNGERVLTWLPPRAQQEATDPRTQSFCENSPVAYQSCRPRGRLLIKRKSKG